MDINSKWSLILIHPGTCEEAEGSYLMSDEQWAVRTQEQHMSNEQ